VIHLYTALINTPCQHVHKPKALLTDIVTGKMAHMEMIASLVYKLVEGASAKYSKEVGWASQYDPHRKCEFWTDALFYIVGRVV